MVNKALRIPELGILFRLRLFIQDLFQQIENEAVSEAITVYLGQTIQQYDLDDLEKDISNNDIIIFPQFLFGSTDKSRAIRVAREIPPINDRNIPLLLRVEIPEGIKYANLNSRRYSVDENNNVLLNMGLIGCLTKIEKQHFNEDRIATIDIKLVKLEDKKNVEQILQTIRTEIEDFSPFVAMIKLMIKVNIQASAEQLIKTLFHDENLKSDTKLQNSIAIACHTLAESYRKQDDYRRALDLYLVSLNAFYQIISPNSIALCSLYSDIGSMYFRLETYEQSYQYYQKALEIQLHSVTPDLYSVSKFTNGIGLIYSKQGKYAEAIKSFERTLKVLQQCSESHDAELSATYNYLGDVYLIQSKYDEALNNYSKSLEIQEHIQPHNLQTLSQSYQTIGNVYVKLGRSKEALSHFKRALEHLQEVLPSNDSTFVLLYNNIGLLHYRELQYDDALKCYSKAREVAAKSLPENHAVVGITFFNTALVYSDQGKYDEAIENIEKSTAQFLKTLPADHPDIKENNKYIESIKQKQTL
jgi:tetratricopeptide (TPR) repeat protein